MEQKDIELPSGAKLKITLAPFAEAKNLYQVILKEAKEFKLDPNSTDHTINLKKDIFCSLMGSKEIDAAVMACSERCLYLVGKDKSKVSADLFESEKAREDYFTVCFEIAKANIMPFMKSLLSEYGPILETLKADLS